MDPSSIASSWAFTVRSVQSASGAASRLCGETEFAAIIMELASQFCMQPDPHSATEVTQRIQQSNHVIAIIGGITKASRAAAEHPKLAAKILSSTEEFVVRLTPERCTAFASSELAKELADICSVSS
jgi:hypothetical protein